MPSIVNGSIVSPKEFSRCKIRKERLYLLKQMSLIILEINSLLKKLTNDNATLHQTADRISAIKLRIAFIKVSTRYLQ